MKNLISCFILLIVLSGFSHAQSTTKSFTKVGDQMPQFSLKDTNGNSIDISELKGKLLFVNFWATWCGPCLQEMPIFEKQIWLKYKDSPNFRMLAIAREESNEVIVPFKKDLNFTFPIASDSDGAIYKLFGDKGIPRSYVVGADGKIIFQLVGYNSFFLKKMISLIDSEMAKFETKVKL
jgi:peroxiredoxin